MSTIDRAVIVGENGDAMSQPWRHDTAIALYAITSLVDDQNVLVRVVSDKLCR